jgi:peptidoglycan/LPS O-acetylase OafA/YrhL
MAAPSSIGRRAEHRANNFDVLRLIAAAMVLVSHSFALVGSGEPRVGHLALGTLGVVVFFAISGFLIARSWDLRPGLSVYATKRALRIVPALLVVLLASAYLLGAVATNLSLTDYLKSSEPIRYVVGNLTAILSGGTVAHPSYHLPGVFAGNPAGSAVNGSLWTLPIEVLGYAAIAALGVLAVMRRGVVAFALAGLAVLALYAAGVDLPMTGALPVLRWEWALMLSIFAVAGVMWVNRERIPLRYDWGIALAAVWLLTLGTAVDGIVTALVAPYLVLLAAFRTPRRLRKLVRHGDVSYGLYLYAFPVQQAILALWAPGHLGAAGLVALALPVTYLLALASWRLIEAPALRHKPRPSPPLSTPPALERPLVAYTSTSSKAT